MLLSRADALIREAVANLRRLTACQQRSARAYTLYGGQDTSYV